MVNVRRLVLLLLLLGSSAARAEISVQVDRNPVFVGEAFNLTVTATEASDGDPDFAVLEQRLRILRRSSGTQLSIVNGRSSRQRTWEMVAVAEQAGTLTIPAIRLGNQQSQPVQLQVQARDPNAASSAPAFIEFEADTSEAWLRQQVLLTVRLYVSGNLVSGGLSEPSAEGIVIEQLGEQSEDQVLKGNTRYRVIERKYALFAEAAGELTVEAPVFNGELSTGSRSSFGFGLLRDNSTPVYAAGKPIRLQIKAPPASAAGSAWLPARNVRLSEQKIPSGGPYEAGHPFTRVITLEVDGQLHTQLPLPEFQTLRGAQQYPESPQGETAAGPSGVRGRQVLRQAVIPNQAGKLLLPAIRVPWWDVGSGRARVAEVPAQELQILPSAALPQPAPPSTAPATADDAQPAALNAVPAPQAGYWRPLALFALAGWLLTLLLLIWKRGHRAPQRQHEGASPRLSGLHKAMIRALTSADPRQARSALIKWAAAYSGCERISSLQQVDDQLAPLLDDQAAWSAELQALDAAAYGQRGDWDGAKLRALIKQLPRKAGAGRATDGGLAPLYPTS